MVLDMALIKIGKLITISNEKNTAGKDLPFFGININKEFMPTAANIQGIDGSKYKIVKKGRFVFSGMQTGRDGCIRIGLYEEDDEVLISPAYTTFEVSNEQVLPEYLFMLFKSEEMDRYGAFLSDSSVRANLDWERFIDIEIDLPNIEIQKKYVAIYKGLKKNLRTYQSRLEDIKLTLDGYIDTIDKNLYDKIGNYIELNDKRNDSGVLTEKDIRGFNADGYFITPMRTFAGEINNFRIISKGDFVYNPRIPTVTYPVALNLGDDLLVSPAYVTFNIKKKDLLDDEYFLMLQQRKNFSRKILFNTWGSSTPFLRHEDLCDITIPIPDMKIQKSLTSIFRCYLRRKEIVEKLKEKINNICPILIRGAVKEAKNG